MANSKEKKKKANKERRTRRRIQKKRKRKRIQGRTNVATPWGSLPHTSLPLFLIQDTNQPTLPHKNSEKLIPYSYLGTCLKQNINFLEFSKRDEDIYSRMLCAYAD